MKTLPTVDLGGHQVSRMICGGNPFSGFSHVSAEVDREMIEYFTMPNLLKLLDDCWANGINTFQSRGDRHQMRLHLEHRLNGGKMNWIAQTASEFGSIPGNIREIAEYKPIAIYHHGSHTDNSWYRGEIDKVHDLVKAIHDQGLPAGIGTHIPAVIEYIEEKGWDTDFYMCCFYDLARGYKRAPAVDQDAYANDHFPAGDPERMTGVMRNVDKPCIGFKVLEASRRCTTRETIKDTFQFAFDNIKPGDMIDIGMFPKYKNQAEENSDIVREILG